MHLKVLTIFTMKACNASKEQILFNLYKEISLYYGMRIFLFIIVKLSYLHNPAKVCHPVKGTAKPAN